MNYKGEENMKKWDTAVRWACGIGAIASAVISAQFAVDGFSFDFPGREWMGWVMAALFIVVELAWNKKGAEHGITMYAAGVACYMFGIYTNVIGIALARAGGLPIKTNFATNAEWIVSWLIPSVFGFFLEVLPEPLFIFALTGESILSDPLKNFKKFKKGFGMNEADFPGSIPRSTGNRTAPVRVPRQEYRKPVDLPQPVYKRQTGAEPTYHTISQPEEPSVPLIPGDDDEAVLRTLSTLRLRNKQTNF